MTNYENIHYKDYTGSIEWSKEDKLYHGKLLNISDLIMYEGSNLEELEKYFKEAVDDYIEPGQEKVETGKTKGV